MTSGPVTPSSFANHALDFRLGQLPLRGPQATLDSLDEALLTIERLEEITAAVEATFQQALGARSVAIMLHDEHRHVLQMMPGAFASADGQTAPAVTTSAAGSASARVFASGRPHLSNAARHDPGVSFDFGESFAVERVLSVQLTLPRGPIGVIHIGDKTTDFTRADGELAAAMAPRLAAFVELAKERLDRRRQQRLEQILGRSAESIASGIDCQEVIPPTLIEICRAIGANALAVVVPGKQAVIGRCGTASELESAMIEEAPDVDEIRASLVVPGRNGKHGSAVAHLPIVVGDERLGTLSGLRSRAQPWSDDELDALKRTANQLALAWGAERYQQQRAQLARLEERQRIADELHDDVAQLVFGAQLSLDRLLDEEELSPTVVAAADRAHKLMERVDGAIRSVIQQLERKSTLDLPQRLASAVADVEDEFDVAIHLEMSDLAREASAELRRPTVEAVVKVARESLVNAAKHAAPFRAAVSLDADQQQLCLTVLDDGVGPGPPGRPAGHGIRSLERVMTEQGGSLKVAAGAAGGTTVTAVIPR